MKRPLKDILKDLPEVMDREIPVPEYSASRFTRTRKRKVRNFYLIGGAVAALFILLMTALFQPNHSVAQKIEHAGFQCPVDTEIVTTTEKDRAQLMEVIDDIINTVYKDPENERYVIQSVELSPQSPGGYKDIIQANCSTKVYENSWVIQVTFPDLEPISASMAQGQIFVAKTKEGWIVWEQYH